MRRWTDWCGLKKKSELPEKALTEDSPGRDRFTVEPEWDLGQNDSHEAGHVSLNHKVTDLPLQVEMGHHDCVLTCRGNNETEEEWNERNDGNRKQ